MGDGNDDVHNKLAVGAAAKHPLSQFIRLVLSEHLRYDSVFVYCSSWVASLSTCTACSDFM